MNGMIMRGAFPSRHIPISLITFGCSKESIIFNSFISLFASVFVYSAALKVLVRYAPVFETTTWENIRAANLTDLSVILRKPYVHYTHQKYVYGYHVPDCHNCACVSECAHTKLLKCSEILQIHFMNYILLKLCWLAALECACYTFQGTQFLYW